MKDHLVLVRSCQVKMTTAYWWKEDVDVVSPTTLAVMKSRRPVGSPKELSIGPLVHHCFPRCLSRKKWSPWRLGKSISPQGPPPPPPLLNTLKQNCVSLSVSLSLSLSLKSLNYPGQGCPTAILQGPALRGLISSENEPSSVYTAQSKTLDTRAAGHTTPLSLPS